MDFPLNNRGWLEQRFAELRQVSDEAGRLKGLEEIVNWTDPGPGGFYDNLGDLGMQPHLVRGEGYQKDPTFLHSSLVGFSGRPDLPHSWWTHAEAIGELACRCTMTDSIRMRSTRFAWCMAATAPARKIRLVANEDIEIHPLMAKPAPVRPVEFDIPKQATKSGSLTLSWNGEAGLGREWPRMSGIGSMVDQEMTTENWVSPVKRRLREGQIVTAATITANSVDAAAHLADAGFDFLWVEMEHSPVTLETLRNIVLATRGLRAMPFARVPVNETWMAKRVLDAGVGGVIFPFTSTPELAAQAAAACRYPPHGRRGSGAGLAKFAWPDRDRYYDSADENVMVIAIIEEARAVERIDEIAATPRGRCAVYWHQRPLIFAWTARRYCPGLPP